MANFPHKLIQILLSGLGNRATNGNTPITIRPRVVGGGFSGYPPTVDRRNAPIESGNDYDPESVSPEFRSTQPTPWLDTRARQINPPDELTKLEDEAAWLRGGEDRGRGGSIIEKPTRLRSGLLTALQGIGEAARRNMATGRTDWSDLAGVAGAGAGGAAVGVADPGIIVRARHQNAVAENQQAINDQLERENAKSIIASRKRNDEYKDALEEKYIRDNASREKDIARKQAYQDRSLQLRQDVLNNRISFEQWRKAQAELDQEFDERKFIETQRHNRVTESVGQQNADSNRIRALNPSGTNPEDNTARIAEIDAEIDEYNKQDQSEPSYLPVYDNETGLPATDAKGNIIYSNTPTPEYKDRQIRKRQLLAEKDRLKRPQKTRSVNTEGSAKGQTFNAKAWKAANPNGDVNAAIAKAKRLGYTIVQ